MKTPKKRTLLIKVYCLEAEHQQINDLAKACGKSLSSYLRMRGLTSLNTWPDPASIKALAKINSEQGRLGGLLKALLTNDERLAGYTGRQIHEITRSTLLEIQETQGVLKEQVRQTLRRPA